MYKKSRLSNARHQLLVCDSAQLTIGIPLASHWILCPFATWTFCPFACWTLCQFACWSPTAAPKSPLLADTDRLDSLSSRFRWKFSFARFDRRSPQPLPLDSCLGSLSPHSFPDIVRSVLLSVSLRLDSCLSSPISSAFVPVSCAILRIPSQHRLAPDHNVSLLLYFFRSVFSEIVFFVFFSCLVLNYE